MIIQGFEHKLYFKLVTLGLPKGIGFIAEDTERRKNYLESNPYFPNNMVLFSCMSYCENILNSSSNNTNEWISNYGGVFVDILYSMKIIRNAWTHNNGNISQNRGFNNMNGNQQYLYAKNVLQSNTVDIDCYNFNDANSSINVLSLGCDRICTICTSVFKNAGAIVIE